MYFAHRHRIQLYLLVTNTFLFLPHMHSLRLQLSLQVYVVNITDFVIFLLKLCNFLLVNLELIVIFIFCQIKFGIRVGSCVH